MITGYTLTREARKSFGKLEKSNPRIAQAAREALERLTVDPTHPSLRVKRFQGTEGCYEMRIDQGYRILFVRNRPDEPIEVRDIGKALYDH